MNDKWTLNLGSYTTGYENKFPWNIIDIKGQSLQR